MFYYVIYPRGFGNEYTIDAASTQNQRDYITMYGGHRNRKPLSRKEAENFARWKGNEITEAFVKITPFAYRGLQKELPEWCFERVSSFE